MTKRGIFVLLAIFLTVWLLEDCALAATFSTKNFTVTTSDPRVAEQMANRAEQLRSKLALFWLGKELPNWFKRCKITIKIGNVAAGGQTNFTFNKGEVFGWNMEIQGTVNRVYDSVLPHEITHMLLASHFRTPLPRWADEGAATFTEHESERSKYRQQLYSALKSQKGIPLDRLFEMEEYPADPLPLYAHGFSIAEFLIRQRGPHYYVGFLDACLNSEASWDEIVYEYYGYSSLRNLQEDWVSWVKVGTPGFVGTNLIAGNGVPAQKLDVKTDELMNGETFQDSVPVVPESRTRPTPNLVIWSTTHVNGLSGANQPTDEMNSAQ